MNRFLLLSTLIALPLLVSAQLPEPPPIVETKPESNQPGSVETPLPASSATEEPFREDQGLFRPNPLVGAIKPRRPSNKPGSVAVDFIGGGTFPREEMLGVIQDTLEEIEAQGLNKALADDAAFFLANHYREHGYAQAEVHYEIQGPNRLVLKITEGPLSRIGRVVVTGNQKVKEAIVLDYLLGPIHERFPRDLANPPFVEGDLETGVGWLRAYYLSQGFLNAVIDNPVYDYSGRKSAMDIRIHVSEGTKFTFGRIMITGELLFPPEQLLKQLGDLSVKPYTSQEVLRLQQVLEYFYKTKGYFYATVDSISDPAQATNGRVPTTFVVHPGEQYYFDGITVAGLDRLKANFLPQRFERLTGKVYNPELVQQKTREMTRTGLFKSFRTHEEPLPDHTIRLDLNVEEAKAKELGFLLGYSTLEGAVVGASYRDRNLFGEGRPLTANAQYSTRGLRGEVAYTDPWFIRDLLILRLRLYALTRDYDGYSKVEAGFRGEIARKLTDQLEISIFVQSRHVELQDVLISPDLDDQLEGVHGRERARRRQQATEDLVGPSNYYLNSVGLSENLDTRDSKINPTKGYFVNATVDSAADALGSEISFLRATIASSYYKSLGKKGLLAFGARAGLINPFHARGSLPIDERFFNGGSLSVRSFTERHLGPKDRNGFPVGGDSFTVFNVEYDFPLRGQLEGAAFVDAGSLGAGNTFGEMRYGIGVGLRYRLPIGPLRLDVAANPTRKTDESIGAVHFSFGFAF